MIIVQIHSGLGNQLFMYAAARALAQKHNTDLYLDVDTDCRNGINHEQSVGHSFQLDKFAIQAAFLSFSAVAHTTSNAALALYGAIKTRLRDNSVIRSAAHILRRRGIDPARLLMKASGQERNFFREEWGDWGYKPHFLELPDNTILRGCFFSYRYFEPIQHILRSELTLKAELSQQSRLVERQMLETESVSLHIRRGDVLTNPEYRSWYEGVVTERYYQNAVTYFKERLGDPVFFVFSDDISWVKANFRLPLKLIYVDHNGPEKGYEDLYLMSRCKHNVTTGFSSFSWWAAYMNSNPGKIILRTRRMNAVDRLNHPDHFFPHDWVIVDS